MHDTSKLRELLNSGRLIRHDWVRTDEEGRETACLLVALAPQVGKTKSPKSCPAHVMPQWLAHLTPWIDDTGSVAQWRSTILRYAAAAEKWHDLDKPAWRKLERTVRRIALEECLPISGEHKAAVEYAITLIKREESWHLVPSQDWQAAKLALKAEKARALRNYQDGPHSSITDLYVTYMAIKAALAAATAAPKPNTAAEAVSHVNLAYMSSDINIWKAADRITGKILLAIEDACRTVDGDA
jgi:hypothetical protein